MIKNRRVNELTPMESYELRRAIINVTSSKDRYDEYDDNGEDAFRHLVALWNINIQDIFDLCLDGHRGTRAQHLQILMVNFLDNRELRMMSILLEKIDRFESLYKYLKK